MPKGTVIFVLFLILVLVLSPLLSFGFGFQTARAQQSSGSYSDDFSSDSGLWQYLGTAYRDPLNHNLVLTNSDYFEGGAVFFSAPVQGSFVANFSYKVGGGTAGDGFTMFFYKQNYSTVGNGDTLGFSSDSMVVPGYGIEFDGWQNIPGDFQLIAGGQQNPQGDPSADHIALVQDFTGNHLVYVNDPRVDDGIWHDVSVEVGDSFVGVFVDQGLVLLWDGTFNTTFDGFGFSGATGGGGSNYHVISNFSLTLEPVTRPIGTATPVFTPAPSAPVTLNPSATHITPVYPLPVRSEINQSLQTFSDDFTVNSGAWQYLGTAYRDPTNQDIVLTNTLNDQGGVAFLNYPIKDGFVANFSYKTGGGSGGDGFTIFFYKQFYADIGTGGSEGFTPDYQVVPGYGVEFDTWQNIPQDFAATSGAQQNPQGDPSSNHIALIEDFCGNHLAWVNDPRVDDGNWHNVSVAVGTSSVAVYVDQQMVLQWNGTLNRTFDGFGFSGGTGSATDWHLIGNFSITAQNLKQPTLTTYCVGSESQSGLNVKINGDLSFNGSGVSSAPVLLSYSVTGGESWQDLTLVNTDDNGGYSALWFPSATGDYMIKAVYQGDENYLETANIVNFALESGVEQSIFSVTSNSTISELSFDSSNKELSFNVSGPSGTRGYVNVYVPKSLINDIAGLAVYLDNSQINCTVQSQNAGWNLFFTYHHSSHKVMITLGSSKTNQGLIPAVSVSPLTQTVLLSILLALTALLVVKLRKNKT